MNGGLPQSIISTGNIATLIVSSDTVGTFTYTLESVVDASSTLCSQDQVGEVIVTVNPLPTATIAGDTAVCQNDAYPIVTFTGANGTAPYTFTFTLNGGASQTVISTGDFATLTVPTMISGSFSYTLESVVDASSTLCSQDQIGEVIVTVNPLPTATITGDTVVCQNDASPIVTFTGANGTAPYTFTYTLNGGAPQTLTTSIGDSAKISVPTNNAETFIYHLLSVEDASSTTCVVMLDDSVSVIVKPLPTAQIFGGRFCLYKYSVSKHSVYWLKWRKPIYILLYHK